MSEQPVSAPDALDRANAAYWRRQELEDVTAGTEPFRPDESFEITDLSEVEWAIFVEAIHE